MLYQSLQESIRRHAPHATGQPFLAQSFGKAFKSNGYRFPEDDETYVKSPPIALGAETWKTLPQGLWRLICLTYLL